MVTNRIEHPHYIFTDHGLGLVPAHAYSILGAVEVAGTWPNFRGKPRLIRVGKRFIRIRNPWGKTEWTGRWADGSKEWTSEWLARLPELGHSFGNDGQFLMECAFCIFLFGPVHIC
jgi:hypothetical protein